MRRLTVSIDEQMLERLKEVSFRERRHPSDQAAVILEQSLAEALPSIPGQSAADRIRGALADDSGNERTPDAAA